jgi:hypothetical protein
LDEGKNSEKEKAKRIQKINCIKRNKEVFNMKLQGISLSQERLDPQNESFLEEITNSKSQKENIKERPEKEYIRKCLNEKKKKDSKMVKQSRRKIKEQKVREDESETSDAIESLEEEQNEEEEEINIELRKITKFEMQDQIEAWKVAIEEAEPTRIPRIYLKDFKKVKVGLKKKIDELSLIFNRINASNITGKDDLEIEYIQMAYKFLTYTLQEHIKNAIGKTGKKSNGMAEARIYKKKNVSKKGGINEEALEKSKREELAIFDKKEKAMQELKAEIENIKRIWKQQSGPMRHDTERMEIVEEYENFPDEALLKNCLLKAMAWLNEIRDYVEDFEFVQQ